MNGVGLFSGLALLLASGGMVQSRKPVERKEQSGWVLRTDTDAMTDKVEYAAGVTGTNGGYLEISCTKGDRESISVLVLSKDLPARVVVQPDYLTYRWGTEPAVKTKWMYGQRGAMLNHSTQSTEMLTPMTRNTKLTVRMLAYDDTHTDLVFDMSGGVEVVVDLMKRCDIMR